MSSDISYTKYSSDLNLEEGLCIFTSFHFSGLPDRVTLSAGVKFCHVNVQGGVTRLAGVRFVIHQFRAKFTLAMVLQDKTRQDNALFGVLYSPMYIDFIQII